MPQHSSDPTARVRWKDPDAAHLADEPTRVTSGKGPGAERPAFLRTARVPLMDVAGPLARPGAETDAYAAPAI